MQTKAVEGARAITVDGEQAGLGLSASAGAQCWFTVLTALHTRGVEDGFTAGVDGRKGCPAALAAVWPTTQGQLCMVHQVRHSLTDGPWQERTAVAVGLRASAAAATLAEAAQALERCAARWETTYPTSSPSWLADWDRLTVCFDYPPAMRRVIYTTNAIESLHSS